MKIFYTSKFKREYKKLPTFVKLAAEEKEKVFRKNPFDSILDTHKLHGRLRDFWSFSIGHTFRIIFEFGTENTIYFHSVGNHSIYE